MKRFLLASLALLFSANVAFATPANVSHTLGADGAGSPGGNGSNIVLTFPAAPSGSLVVGAVQRAHTGSITAIGSITDDKGNTYNIADDTDQTTDGQTQATFWLNNVTNGPSTITVTFPGGAGVVTFRRMLIDVFSGVDTSGTPTDGHTAQQNAGSTSTNAQTSGSITTAVNGDLIWTAFSDSEGAGATWSAGTGFTILDNGTSADNDPMGSAWQVQSTAGSIAGTFTENVSSRSVVGVIAFKAAGGGGAVLRLRSLMGVGQ